MFKLRACRNVFECDTRQAVNFFLANRDLIIFSVIDDLIENRLGTCTETQECKNEKTKFHSEVPSFAY
ncbi:hypothetical protein D3C87_1754550 [compost metagenome]